MMKLIISCEHATNLIPQEYQHLFSNAENTLESHRGYDPGTLDLFFHLEKLADFSRFYEWSRLLVEPNRSLHHKNLFSKYTKGSSQKVKNQLIQEYYFPYRNQIERNILESIEKGEKLLHLSLHSFTPELVAGHDKPR